MSSLPTTLSYVTRAMTEDESFILELCLIILVPFTLLGVVIFIGYYFCDVCIIPCPCFCLPCFCIPCCLCRDPIPEDVQNERSGRIGALTRGVVSSETGGGSGSDGSSRNTRRSAPHALPAPSHAPTQFVSVQPTPIMALSAVHLMNAAHTASATLSISMTYPPPSLSPYAYESRQVLPHDDDYGWMDADALTMRVIFPPIETSESCHLVDSSAPSATKLRDEPTAAVSSPKHDSNS